jgi:flagellin-like hook-associated protein FlgL
MALNLGGGSTTSNFNALQLGNAQSLLSKSLMRLSSGQRINRPSDDPGGLAVSMKLSHAYTVASATKNNVDNALSFTDTQDSALESAASILDRMSTIKTTYSGSAVLSSTEKSSYASEFKELQKQLSSFESETFNSLSLFSTTANSKSVYTSTKGSGGASISVSSLNLTAALSVSSGAASRNLADATGSVTISSVSISASCLVCHRRFTSEENSKDMVVCLRVSECVWQYSFVNRSLRVWLQCFVCFRPFDRVRLMERNWGTRSISLTQGR